ncbi:uncharacterized protein LOC115627891 isoform X3 [Scaptodrosophila lebanonensis]|uniref:Uncharacterized protein LOC115627891 isoform X3 n=1 Tax=Drosophila lebanonensis TaxID=7225 RepID=A0A6J2TST4_DROLE|nr:uncharacterized protein LOC115627891 isoform X3 [Scaptodrosophila lebanonensis]
MLHNNANWQQQQQPPPPQQQQLSQQQHNQQQQQQQLYGRQMFSQQPTAVVGQQHWPEQQQAALNYSNYFAAPQSLQQLTPQQQQHQLPQQQQQQVLPQQQQQQVLPQQQQQQVLQQQQLYQAPTPQVTDAFYQPEQQQLPTTSGTTDLFDNNSSSRNDGWGDWGDWNDNANNNNNSISTSAYGNNNNCEATAVNAVEDAFNVNQGQASWQAFGANSFSNNNSSGINVEASMPPTAESATAAVAAPVPLHALAGPPPVPTPAAIGAGPQGPYHNSNNNNISGLELPPPLLPPVLPAAGEPELDAIVPPRAFQNHPAPPPMVTTAESAVVAGSSGNPFKLGGANKPQRVNILSTANSGSSGPLPPPAKLPFEATAYSAAPTQHLLQPIVATPEATAAPDNSEMMYENQEVLAAPNDERAQYLQTSHLSEQHEGEAANWEADSLLPPPGLSRLVLGQPELVDTLQQQRQVTGTEQPLSGVNALHMEERHADGEDTSDGEQLQVRGSGTDVTSTTISSSSTNITADRNLYLVAGESNANVQQTRRVVPGVETIAESSLMTGTPPPLALAGEQREVVLDGENLDDQLAVSVESATQPVAQTGSQSVLTTGANDAHYLTNVATATQHHNTNANNSNSGISNLTGNDEGREADKKSRSQLQQPTARPKQRSSHERQPPPSLESEDESDEFLQSERARDRREARREHEQRSRGDRRSQYGSSHNYDGETEDSVRGGGGGGGTGGHSDSKSTRDTKRRSHDSSAKPRSRGHEQPEQNWRRRSQKHSGGEENSERYERRSRYNNEGESDGGLDGSGAVGGSGAGSGNLSAGDGGGHSSKTSRQRRSGPADMDYYERHERHGSSRRKTDHDRTNGGTHGRRSHEGGERTRRADDSTLERRRRQEQQRHWDPREFEEYRRKSSRNSDLEKERTNGGGGGGGSNRRRNYGQYSAYNPYGAMMMEQISRDPRVYANMATIYGQMINSMAVLNAAAASNMGHTQQAAVATPITATASGASSGAGGVIDSQAAAHHLTGEAALLRERERGGVNSAAPVTTFGVGMPVDSSALVQQPRRRTPLLFNFPHLVASYTMSLLLKVKPRYAGRGKLRHDVEVTAPRIKDATSSLLRAYPGPLQGRKLHKDKIINFCKEQIRLGPTRSCTVLYATQKKPHGSVEKYRASHALMWHFLILLLRQNGVIADTDVGDLLLENQKEYPYAPSSSDAASSELDGGDAVIAEGAGNDSDGGSARSVQLASSTVQSTAEDGNEDENEIEDEAGVKSNAAAQSSEVLGELAATDKFRSYVLRGNVEEALQWATDNSLWAHAFFLALYEDRYALTDVAQKFLNRAIKPNDPLQTLYQMKSCHTPTCVSQLRDEHWGDWRAHLAILVTNKSRQPEYDRSSVVALGDTLYQRGDIYAAHFCYLVAQEEFGRYDSMATEHTTLNANVPKLILLGASHYKQFNEFASNEAIIMTEIYEYARSLFDNKFSIANFQHYKFLLATRILDYGQHFRCTNYLEQIAKHIELKPELYTNDFIQRVASLAERLRYHDPILINRVSFASPPSAGSNNSNQNAAQGGQEEKAWLRTLRALADMQQQQQPPPQQQLPPTQSEIDQQFAEVNKQFRELNMQYAANNIEQTLQDASISEQQQQQQQQPQQQQQSQMTGEQVPYETQSDYYKQTVQANERVADAVDPYAQQQQHNPMYYDPNMALQQQQPPSQLYDATAAQSGATNVYGGHIEAATDAYADQAASSASQYGGDNPVPVPGYDYWPTAQAPHPYGGAANADEPSQHMESSENSANNNNASLDNGSVGEQQLPQHHQQLELPEKSLSETSGIGKQKQKLQHIGGSSKINRFKPNALKVSGNNNKPMIYAGKATRKLQFANSSNDSNITSSSSMSKHTPTQIYEPAISSVGNAFNLNDQQQQQQRPAISMPRSKTYDDEDGGKAQTGGGGGAANTPSTTGAAKTASKAQSAATEPGAQGNQNAGWFGGLWNKLSLKPKNQMILPDDKNPTIVWDKERKCWTNTEANAEESESFKPPPKMSDLGMGMGVGMGMGLGMGMGMAPPVMPSQQPQSLDMLNASHNMYGNQVDYTATAATAAPTAVAAPTTPIVPEMYAAAPSPAPVAPTTAPSPVAPGGPQPKLQSNMFKMQRNRTLKNSYVDVFNPSGAPMAATPENVLAPIMAPAAMPQGGYFVPGASSQQPQQ